MPSLVSLVSLAVGAKVGDSSHGVSCFDYLSKYL